MCIVRLRRLAFREWSDLLRWHNSDGRQITRKTKSVPIRQNRSADDKINQPIPQPYPTIAVPSTWSLSLEKDSKARSQVQSDVLGIQATEGRHGEAASGLTRVASSEAHHQGRKKGKRGGPFDPVNERGKGRSRGLGICWADRGGWHVGTKAGVPLPSSHRLVWRA